MTVSVAMTTYNGARYVKEQLGSFSCQTRLPDEVIICDDVSTDETVSIICHFAETAPFKVKIFVNEKSLGFTKNFSKAIQNCNGKFIFFSDQDDVWFPDKINKVLEEFSKNPAIKLVVHDGYLTSENLVSTGVTMLQQVVRGYGNERSLVTGALTCVKQELLPLLLPIPDRIVGHDIWFHSFAEASRVRRVLPLPLQLLRRHSQNTSNWVVSSPKAVSKLQVRLSQLRASRAANYDDRLYLNFELTKRVKAASNVSGYSIESLKQALCDLRKERVAILLRNELTRAGFWNRKRIAMQCLCTRQYRHFNGFFSFFVDILR